MGALTQQNANFKQLLPQLDLTTVMLRVADETGMSDEQLARAEQWYRCFLKLKADGHKGIAPPVLADYVWHEHVLHTRQYAADCEKLFGEFLHHDPQPEVNQVAWRRTQELYAKEFGINLKGYQAVPAGCG